MLIRISPKEITHQKNKPILFAPSKIKIPVGVNPRAYSQPSLPYKQTDDYILNTKFPILI